VHTGNTGAFLAHTPRGTVPGRAAEEAYASLLSAYGSD
jgi:hypothetical protein